jgi:phthalate 4,5-cis-dihydrodiol dehydrogenase
VETQKIHNKIGVGVVGLGKAFAVMLPTFQMDPRVQIVAGTDPREEARRQLEEDFSANTYSTVEELCSDPLVEVVYIATPHQFHLEHTLIATSHGKHVLVEKPMAITLEDCNKMIAAASQANVTLIVGHSHGFDTPILRTRQAIESGKYGAVRMISALDYTDFLYRPRRPEELDTAQGGGVIYNQALHQIDILRLLGGGIVSSVRAGVGAWDASRPTEGAYSAFLTFENGVFASATYSGYARFDSDEFCGWIGESGQAKNPDNNANTRNTLLQASATDAEMNLKNELNYGGDRYRIAQSTNGKKQTPLLHQHFGLILVSCEKADLRPLPTGVMVYDDHGSHLEVLDPPVVFRGEVIDELYNAIVNKDRPIHSGEWGMATLEVGLALLQSAQHGKEIILRHQIGLVES